MVPLKKKNTLSQLKQQSGQAQIKFACYKSQFSVGEMIWNMIFFILTCEFSDLGPQKTIFKIKCSCLLFNGHFTHLPCCVPMVSLTKNLKKIKISVWISVEGIYLKCLKEIVHSGIKVLDRMCGVACFCIAGSIFLSIRFFLVFLCIVLSKFLLFFFVYWLHKLYGS